MINIAKKNKKQSMTWLWLILSFLFGALVLYLVNNFTVEPAYEVISCTNNQFSCDMPAWNGVCTQEIEDECCEEIRVCSGTVEDPYDCLDKYCYEEGEKCLPFDRIDQKYDCRCADIDGEQTSC